MAFAQLLADARCLASDLARPPSFPKPTANGFLLIIIPSLHHHANFVKPDLTKRFPNN
jgi:hypothetical protein